MLLLVFLIIITHIIDDFILQQLGNLHNMKQKKFWEPYNKEYNNKYCLDHYAGLVIHCISWSIMVHLPLLLLTQTPEIIILVSSILHAINHGIIDNKKCNKHELCLVEDQLLHCIQLCLIWWTGVYFI